tara:strand:- start:20 stop:265 length:246 start_codon:yes stop_codon:yes gene_type:complete
LGLLIKDIFRVLKRINPIDINKGKFHLSLKFKDSLFLNERNNDINKNNAPIGKAEGKKKTPNKKNLFPRFLFIISFKELLR